MGISPIRMALTASLARSRKKCSRIRMARWNKDKNQKAISDPRDQTPNLSRTFRLFSSAPVLHTPVDPKSRIRAKIPRPKPAARRLGETKRQELKNRVNMNRHDTAVAEIIPPVPRNEDSARAPVKTNSQKIRPQVSSIKKRMAATQAVSIKIEVRVLTVELSCCPVFSLMSDKAATKASINRLIQTHRHATDCRVLFI